MIDDVINIILDYAAGATVTPDQATTVLNVLSATRAPSVLAAVLDRGFREYNPSRAIKHGLGPTLLPQYPPHILFGDIYRALGAAAVCGDMPTIKLLWRLAGPATAARLAWVEEFDSCFIDKIIKSGHSLVLEWFEQAVGSVGIPVNWSAQAWVDATEVGHTKVVSWAIAHGHLNTLDCATALLSTRHNDMSMIEWWIAAQSSNEMVLQALNDVDVLIKVSNAGATVSLDWWWAYTGSKLPEPEAFAKIVNAALASRSMATVQWWWSRFLEHRMPEHAFEGSVEIGQFNCVEDLEWDMLVTDWSPELVYNAARSGQSKVLKWWDLHRDELPAQDLDPSVSLFYAARMDAIDVLEWWLTRLPASKADWYSVVGEAVSSNACHTQEWLTDHAALFAPASAEERRRLLFVCESGLHFAKAFTLDFLRSHVPEFVPTTPSSPPEQVYRGLSFLYWWCSRANVSLASLLPLHPPVVDMLLERRDITLLEWWMQAQLDSGHPVIWTTAVDFDEMFGYDPCMHRWMYDLTVTRKVSVFIELKGGIVPKKSTIAMDLLLPDEFLVRVSTYLDLPAILAYRATSQCLVNLTPFMLEHAQSTRALMAVVSGSKTLADTIFRAPKDPGGAPLHSGSLRLDV
ncbi:hypothetical protein BC828DRAFT_407701 [Blastocladiella britannica]|nr:hypothetical protein BC828DRAFT_407701 [Blastocladiella britannica]